MLVEFNTSVLLQCAQNAAAGRQACKGTHEPCQRHGISLKADTENVFLQMQTRL